MVSHSQQSLVILFALDVWIWQRWCTRYLLFGQESCLIFAVGAYRQDYDLVFVFLPMVFSNMFKKVMRRMRVLFVGVKMMVALLRPKYCRCAWAGSHRGK